MDNYPFEMECSPGSPVDWYQARMKMSGITIDVARKCGFRLVAPDDFPFYIEIPYFTIDGTRDILTRQRNRILPGKAPREHGPKQSSGEGKGKYTQRKGTKNQVYWPPVADQTQESLNPACPLIVCEGEFKAVACKMHTLKEGPGHETLVCGVPGTSIDDNVRAGLKQIRCRGAGDEARIVFLAMDWNGTGSSKERSAGIEFELKTLFQSLGAKVVILRWKIERNAGEQKLDDWLVAGGDLSAAMAESSGRKAALDTKFEVVWDYLNSHYCIMHGKYVPLSNMSQKYTITDLAVMEPQARVQISEKKFLSPSDVWTLQAKELRNEVDGYTFLPAPLGVMPERYVHEDGMRLLNTAPNPQWLAPPWGEDVPDCTPFLNLVKRLCQDGSEWFLNFLAHCAQFPEDRGAHIVVFKDDGGTGKSRLFETLDLVFGKYSGPIGDSLTSSFNAMLEHLVIAWWSDPVIHSGFDRDLESALKNFSGDSRLIINHKGGAKYSVRGFGRLIIATNKEWIVPVDSKERRYAVFGGGQNQMPHTEAGAYMAWLHEGGVNAIRLLLTQRDLSAFDIHEQAPVTTQRIEMEAASAPPLVKLLMGESFEISDVWSTKQITEAYNATARVKKSTDEIGKALAKLDFVTKPKNPIRVGNGLVRLTAIRDPQRWAEASTQEFAEEYKKTLIAPDGVKY